MHTKYKALYSIILRSLTLKCIQTCICLGSQAGTLSVCITHNSENDVCTLESIFRKEHLL